MVFFELARKNVTRKRERSLLTIVAVLLAIGSFISLLSIAEGGYQKTRLELDGRDVNVYVLPRGIRPLPALAAGSISPSSDTLPDTLPAALSTRFPEIEHCSGVARLNISHNDRSILVWGLDEQAIETFLPHLASTEGGPLQDEKSGPPDILLGVVLARQMDLVGQVGASLTLGRTPLKLVGVVDSTASLQASYGYVLPATAKALANLSGVHEVWIRCKDPATAASLANDIMTEHPEVAAYTNEQYMGASLELVHFAWLVQFAVASIGVLISMTAAMNTMLMSTYERLREFGTLRAIGTPRTTVLAMIVTESLILSMLGGLGGVVLGVVGSRIFDVAVTTLFRFSFSLASITVGLIADGLLLSFGVGVVGAVIPCYVVYNMEIIRALRSE